MVLKQSSLRNQREFLITCQQCPRIYKITPIEVEHSDRICKIFGMKGFYIYQCKCGARFNVQLDFRNKSRYPSEIGSFYTTLTKRNYRPRLDAEGQHPYKTSINSVIKNISVDGIGFSTHDHHNIELDDELLVKFIIRRNGKDRLLERKIIVRAISGDYIGAEFFPDDKKDPELGFYLMVD